jgi:hypothetical protein
MTGAPYNDSQPSPHREGFSSSLSQRLKRERLIVADQLQHLVQIRNVGAALEEADADPLGLLAVAATGVVVNENSIHRLHVGGGEDVAQHLLLVRVPGRFDVIELVGDVPGSEGAMAGIGVVVGTEGNQHVAAA